MVVWAVETPKRFNTWRQREDINCRPWSVTMQDGTPKREIQPRSKAVAQDTAVMSANGKASTQREKRSMTVSK